MTFKRKRKGFWFFKSFQYELLMVDTDAFFILQSKQELSAHDLDILFLEIIKTGRMKGEIKTEKGIIKFRLSNVYQWLDDHKKDEQ